MTTTITVFLDLSDDVQKFVERQQIDLYRELRDELRQSRKIQQEFSSIELKLTSDPDVPDGTKSLVTAIVAATEIVTAATAFVAVSTSFVKATTEFITASAKLVDVIQPGITRILDQFNHNHTKWEISAKETRHPDKKVTIHIHISEERHN